MDSEPSLAGSQALANQARACLTCSIAKVRCVYSGKRKCDRCMRLDKNCVLQPMTAKRTRKRRTNRVAQLEQKLDGLVNLLTAKETSIYTTPDSLVNTNVMASPEIVHMTTLQDPEPSKWPHTPENNYHDLPGDFGRVVRPSTAEVYLDIYKSKIMPNFPFVALPPRYSADKLQKEKPALFRSVMMAASYHDSKDSLKLGEELLPYLIDHIVIKAERSLDLLQALLIYIAWYHSLFHVKRRLKTLVQIGNAVATEMTYTRAPQAVERYLASMDWANGLTSALGFEQSGIRTLDERRAYTGLYYLSSRFVKLISESFRRSIIILTCYHKEFQALRSTPYLEDCCVAIENATEYPSDRFLVNVTRLHIMNERIAQTFTFQGPNAHLAYHVPVRAYLQPFKAELMKFKGSIPDDMNQRDLLLLHYHSVEIYLYEVGLYGPSQMSRLADSSIERVEILYACLYSIEAFHAKLDAIPTSEWYHLPCLLWTQMTHSVINLAKLSLLETDGWDLDHVRRILDLSSLLQKLAYRFREARSYAGLPTRVLDNDPDVFSRYARRLQHIKEKYDLKIGGSKDTNGVDQTMNTSLASTEYVNQIDGNILSSIDDEAFWRDMLGDWDPSIYMQC